MRVEEAITQQIRDVTDIVQVIGQYVTLKHAGKDFRGSCPFHKEKTPSFYVRPVEQYFKCFGCGVGGDVFKFLQLYDSVSFQEARQILAERANINLEHSSGSSAAAPMRGQVLRANRWAAEAFRELYLGEQGKLAREYVAARRISEEMSASFLLGFAPDSFDFLTAAARRAGYSDEVLLAAGLIKRRQGSGCYDTFRNRLIFPILDPAGQVIGFGGRTLGDDAAKYINSPETVVFNKSKTLYGLHMSREAFKKRERAVLVEGYTDVIMAHQHGFAETVATLGTAITEQHAHILGRYVPHVVLLFDADLAGMKAADRGIEIAIRSQLDVSLARVPDGKDPCDFLTNHTASEFEDLLNSAFSVLEFKWKQVLKAHQEEETSSAKLQAMQDFVSFVGANAAFGGLDAIQRGLVVNQLARLLGVSKQEINTLLEAAKNRIAASASNRRAGQTDPALQGQMSLPSRPPGSEQAAAVKILTVILNEPGLFQRVTDVFDVELFDDPQLRRVAQATVDLIDQEREFAIAELLGKFEDPADSARVVSLVEEGRSAGNLEARLEDAANRLRTTVACARLSHQAGQEFRSLSSADNESAREDQDRKLREVHSSASDYASVSNFTGIRKFNLRSNPS